MSNNTAQNSTAHNNTANTLTGDHAAETRRSTETKASTKTTEFFAYVAMVLATIVTAVMVGNGDGGGEDIFDGRDAMQLITYLTIGYMVARGLAKSGSREYYNA